MKNLFLFFCSLVATNAMQAQIRHVPTQYPTIQAGISASNPGDTVLVAEGTYYEQINFLGKKPLMVASEFLMDGDTSHISNTIIDGSQLTNPDSASVVYFISGEDTTSILCGFTIRGGKGTNTFSWGLTMKTGGGIFISRTGASILHNRITDNVIDDMMINVFAFLGGGIYSDAQEEEDWVVIENNIIYGNKVTSTSGGSVGGGIYTCNNARIINNIISDNISQNIANGWSQAGGGQIDGALAWGHIAVFSNNLIKNNISQSDEPGYGGICIIETKGEFSSNEVIGNKTVSASTWGDCGGLGLYNVDEDFVIRNNTFIENFTTPHGNGGGLGISADILYPNTILVENNYFLDNEALSGGGLFSINNPLVLQNNVFTGNHADAEGGAVYIENTGSLPDVHPFILINNSFFDNNAEFVGGAIYSLDANPFVFNSIFWHDSLTNAFPQEIWVESGFVEIVNSDIDTNFIWGTIIDDNNLINEDPLFADPVTLLTEHWSPCVDAGVEGYTCNHGITYEAPDYDITGAPRPVGAGYDMGAYDLKYWGVGVERNTNDDLRITNWPNPISESTTFSFFLIEPASVTIQIFNSFGQLVAEPLNTTQVKGEHHVQWNANNLPAGMYYYRLQAGNKAGSGKMIKW